MRQGLMGFVLGMLVLGGGDTVYSPHQISVPSRTALKVTTDPANVWSWHKEIVLPSNQTTVRERVLVDFDGNGRMDTEDPEVRVTVTDMQFVMPANAQFTAMTCALTDGQHRRWTLFTSNAQDPRTTHNLTTPLVLIPRSDLFVEITYSNAPASVAVNLIGRSVVL